VGVRKRFGGGVQASSVSLGRTAGVVRPRWNLPAAIRARIVRWIPPCHWFVCRKENGPPSEPFFVNQVSCRWTWCAALWMFVTLLREPGSAGQASDRRLLLAGLSEPALILLAGPVCFVMAFPSWKQPRPTAAVQVRS